jgi:hypothetical protein
MTRRLHAAPHARALAGVQLELSQATRLHAENKLRDDFEGMLQVLALRSKATGLTREELNVVVGAMGVVAEGAFRPFLDILGSLTCTSQPEPREIGGGRRNTYRFELKEFDAALMPLVETGLRQLTSVLQSWTQDASVVVEAKLAGETGETLSFS